MLEVSERQSQSRSKIMGSADVHVEVYMIRTPRLQPTLFLSTRSLEICAQSEVDKFGRFIRKLMRNRYAAVRWVGRVTRIAHRYYQRLEDRIDPLERMIKALNWPNSVRVLHASNFDAESQFRDLLRGQRVKHTAWLVMDGVVTTIAIMFFWVLVPIPGPNIFFYYPALRSLSHYRAITGARRALSQCDLTFVTLSELTTLEEDLRNPDLCSTAGSRAGIEGLDHFLKRMA